jgi:hypothetical protein
MSWFGDKKLHLRMGPEVTAIWPIELLSSIKLWRFGFYMRKANPCDRGCMQTLGTGAEMIGRGAFGGENRWIDRCLEKQARLLYLIDLGSAGVRNCGCTTSRYRGL